MALTGSALLRRIFTTSYSPEPTLRTFLERAQTQQSPAAEVTVAVLDAAESARLCGVPLARRGLQPVFLRVANRGTAPLRLQVVNIDPNYFTPLEAAGVNHYSLLKRLSAFGILGWFLLPFVLLLLPLKLITAYRANGRMDECFRSLAFRLRPVAPGAAAEGFIFTRLDAGTKVVHIYLHAMSAPIDVARANAEVSPEAGDRTLLPSPLVPSAVEFTFDIPVPGIKVDYHRRDFETLIAPGSIENCGNVLSLVEKLRPMPAATTNKKGTGSGDPVNLVVIGEFESLISAFAARWDETETITLATCWKTSWAYLLGSQYRYSPVSSLYLFGRNQDVALQRSRSSINERLHLRLWLTPLRFLDRPVWVGQVSRDIGVRFTPKTWNLTTHRIDPEVDEARDYVVEDLFEAERLEAAGYVDGVGACDPAAPRRNLTGDPYFTDGKRAVILVSATRTAPKFMAWE
jgi:LssY C-terminus